MFKNLVGGVALLAMAACSGPAPEVTEEDLARVIPGGVSRGQYCPRAEIRAGTQGYPVYARGRDFDPQAVLYQGAINETARECNFVEGSFTMRIGVNGRVLRGPGSFGAQSVNLPVRFVVVGPDGNPAYSELRNVSLVLAEGSASTTFSIVQENVVVARQPGDSTRDYTVLVGFDQPRSEQ